VKIIKNLGRIYNRARDGIKKGASRSSRNNPLGKSVQQINNEDSKKDIQRIKDEIGQNLAKKEPAPQKQDLLARFKTGKETEADKAFIEQQLKLKYNRLDHKFSPPERIQARMEKEILDRCGDFFSDTKRFIKLIQENKLAREDHQVLNAFGLKAHPDGSLEIIQEPPLNPLEKKLCESFDNSLKHILHTDDIKDPALKYTIRLIRTGLCPQDDFSEQVQEELKKLNLKIEDGKLVE
jgi:hypothetical protein